MPVSLMLMTPYFVFNLQGLPPSFLNLQTEFYKRQCSYCHLEKQDNATCLLCGQTMCWVSKYENSECDSDRSIAKLGIKEGVLSYHARVCEGGMSIFLHTSSGKFLFIQNGSSAFMDSPYRNKYGEPAHPEDKRWDSFVIDLEGGGEAAIEKIRKAYLNFQIGNQVLQQRMHPDQRKVFHKHAL